MAKKRGKMHLHLKKGALHKALGVKKGDKIPVSTLQKEKNSSNPKMRKRANFALNARKWHHGGSDKSGRGRYHRSDKSLRARKYRHGK